jgi:hypothetical protein
MNLTPLFEGESRAKHLSTIAQNLEMVCGRLLGSGEQYAIDRLRLMEHAVKIENKQEREAFVDLISKWAFLADRQNEAARAGRCVIAQVQSLVKQESA